MERNAETIHPPLDLGPVGEKQTMSQRGNLCRSHSPSGVSWLSKLPACSSSCSSPLPLLPASSPCIRSAYLGALFMNEARCSLHIDHFCPSPFLLSVKGSPPAPSWLLSPPPARRSYYMKRSAYHFSSEQRLSLEHGVVQ